MSSRVALLALALVGCVSGPGTVARAASDVQRLASEAADVALDVCAVVQPHEPRLTEPCDKLAEVREALTLSHATFERAIDSAEALAAAGATPGDVARAWALAEVARDRAQTDATAALALADAIQELAKP